MPNTEVEDLRRKLAEAEQQLADARASRDNYEGSLASLADTICAAYKHIGLPAPEIDYEGDMREFVLTLSYEVNAARAQLAAARDFLMQYLIGCPDCDHGIRGGEPCETCGGEGYPPLALYIQLVIEGIEKRYKRELEEALAAAKDFRNWSTRFAGKRKDSVPIDDELLSRIINECDTLDITRVSEFKEGKWHATTIFDGDAALLRTFKNAMLAAPQEKP